MVETLHRVAETVGETVDVFEIAHNGDAVAHLEAEVGRSEEVYAGTVDASGVELVSVVEA